MKYNDQFYRSRHAGTLRAAQTILSIVQETVPEIKSAVDVGCGIGSWLSVLQERGVKDILGIDGEWVKEETLKIDAKSFMKHDLNQGIELPRKFDLAISLEVAEHLKPQNAERFVRSLANLSDFVLFSAAVPGQGGTSHINEQWQDYWVELFRRQGFARVDIVRRRVWDEPGIQAWYKQNSFLFVKNERAGELAPAAKNEELPIRVIHPDLYTQKIVRPSLVQSVKAVFRALKRLLFPA